MAANRVKGITIEIGGDTTGLDKALKGTNSNIKNTQAQLKDVNRLLKCDPKNTERLAQKQKLLANGISETKNKLNTLKEAEKQLQDAVDSARDKTYGTVPGLEEAASAEEALEALEQERDDREYKSNVLSGFLFEMTEFKYLDAEFTDARCIAMLDHVTIYADGRMIYSFLNGSDITVML